MTMNDGELIQRAREAWDVFVEHPTSNDAEESAKEAMRRAGYAIIRAADERDTLRKKREELRKACAEVIGADPDTWPDHGNVELAVTACLALRQNELKQMDAFKAETEALRKRVAELERGEHICKQCGLRKDSDKVEADF